MVKKKILTISDSPLGTSGVGIQAKLFIEALLKTGKYSVYSFAGAIEHKQYNPIRFKEWGEDWTIFPVKNFGTSEMIRSAIYTEKIDMVWFMGDPRFFYPLFANALEMRSLVPMVFYTIWDNYPIPKFNVYHYGSVDAIVSQSLVTKDIIEQVAPENVLKYHIPLTVDTKVFNKSQDPNIFEIKKQMGGSNNRFVFFWNNRNARRKHPATLMMWFKKFAQQVEAKYGKEKAPILVMHTNPIDPAGHDLHVVFRDFELDGYVKISNHAERPLTREQIALLYNAVDCTVSISDAEGFGLCLGSDSLVKTESGYCEIKDVKVGERVFCRNGETQKVTKLFNREAPTKTYLIGGIETRITDEHPVFSLKRNRRSFDSEGLHKEEPNWNKAGELAVGDFIAFPKPKMQYSQREYFDLCEYVDKEKLEWDEEFVWEKMGYSPHKDGDSLEDIRARLGCSKHEAEQVRRIILGNASDKYKKGSFKIKELLEKYRALCGTTNIVDGRKKIKRYIKNSLELSEIIGWYVAEGSSLGSRGVEYSLNVKELPVAKRLQELFRTVFGAEGVVKSREDKNVSSYICASGILASFFEKECGKHAGNKFLNKDFIFSTSSARILLYSLFSGDGSFGKNIITYSTVSRKLAYETRDLLLSMNIFSSLVRRKKIKTTNGEYTYTLVISGRQDSRIRRFFEIESSIPSFSRKRGTSIIEKEDMFLVPIRSVKQNETENVYDIEVEKEHNFISGGILVHNCVGESLASATPVIVTKTGGMQEQVTDGQNVFGVSLEPKSRVLVGSLDVPYIYEDRVLEEDFIDACWKMYEMPKEERDKLGFMGRQHIESNYGIDVFTSKWQETVDDIVQKCGSWGERKNFKRWSMEKL